MLLASGVKLQDTYKIIPIIIDVDAKNADTTRALQALESYKVIRQKGYNNTEDIGDGFFNADLNTLSSLKPSNETNETIEDSFQLQFDNLETTFIKYIDPHEELTNHINSQLLEALYDNTPSGHDNFSYTELNLRLDKGFKGNPNIGCVVFNNLAKTKEFRFVLKSIGDNDRIFIISSIFGGTGSSGFPQLVRLLHDEERLRKNVLGALTVMPYFTVTDNKRSAINSDGFGPKTEAAITYYAKYLKGKINCFYQLWDMPLKQYENHEGGEEQKNNAHLLELIGATSIIDFANKQDGAFKPKEKTEYFDFGIKQEDQVIDVRHFHDVTRDTVLLPMTLFTYALKLWVEIIPSLRNDAFYKELGLGERSANDAFYQHLTAFFREHYKNWLTEMTENDRKFQPFNIAEEMNALIRGKPIPKRKLFDNSISETFIRTKLGRTQAELEKSIASPEKRVLKLLNAVAKDCYTKLESLPTMA